MVTERAAAEANNGRQTDRDVDNGSILPSSLGNLFLELDQNPPLPAGWEMCLDLQSGSIYFRDRTSGTCTYKDPRSCSSKKQATSPVLGNFFSGVTALSGPGFAIGYKHSRNRSVTLEEKLASWNNCRSYATTEDATILELSLKADYGVGATGWSTEEGSEESVAFENDGTRSLPVMCVDLSSLVEESSVCTVEKVKNALKRSHFRALSRNDSGCTNSSLSSLHTLSLNLPSPSSPPVLRACRSFRSYASSNSSSRSAMSFQGDETEELKEEVSSRDKNLACDSVINQSVLRDEEKSAVMITFGCQRCLMYIMLPKANTCCPKCGSGDLLEITATSMVKRQRVI